MFMSTARLTGKIVLVTGGSRGIGAAICRALAQEKATIVLTFGHDAEAAERMCDELVLGGVRAEAIRCDMEIPSQIESLFAAVKKNHGRLDVLVNNAAVGAVMPLEAVDVAQFARFFNINVRGPLLAIQQAVPLFGTDGGRIINISSAVVRDPAPQFSLYAATKAALDAITRSLARELGPRGILLYGIAPGLVETEMSRGGLPDAVFSQTAQATPLGRVGTPEDIAGIVTYLAAGEAAWLTGEILTATGGR
jgi:3-oxoacyl-[acyl-carrier protein] reductase